MLTTLGPYPPHPARPQKVCKKVFQTKRAAFDSKAHALPEEAKALAAKASPAKAPPGQRGAGARAAAPAAASFAGGDDGGKKGAWEDKSKALRDAMRAAREYKAAIAAGKSGADLPPPPTSAPDPSLVQARNWRAAEARFLARSSGHSPAPSPPRTLQCPTCGRSFNSTAAERHIPKCASIINKVCVCLVLTFF